MKTRNIVRYSYIIMFFIKNAEYYIGRDIIVHELLQPKVAYYYEIQNFN